MSAGTPLSVVIADDQEATYSRSSPPCRARVNLDPRAVARALGGQAYGNNVLAPGPGHSPRDRSLSILVSFEAPEGFLCYSHAGDDYLACRDFVRERLGLSREHLGNRAPTRLNIVPREAILTIDRERAARPLALWHEAKAIIGTPAEAYLASRKLAYEGQALRWHRACPFARVRTGCMLALVRNILTNEPQAIHRTALTPDGRKAVIDGKCRMALGPIAGGAIQLTDHTDVELSLGLAEGIETALTMRFCREVGHAPAWAALNAGGIQAFPVLPGIRTLWIGVDHDPTGLEASRMLAHRWHQAGREVFLITPREQGLDLNDLLKENADA